LTVSLN